MSERDRDGGSEEGGWGERGRKREGGERERCGGGGDIYMYIKQCTVYCREWLSVSGEGETEIEGEREITNDVFITLTHSLTQVGSVVWC